MSPSMQLGHRVFQQTLANKEYHDHWRRNRNLACTFIDHLWSGAGTGTIHEVLLNSSNLAQNSDLISSER